MIDPTSQQQGERLSRLSPPILPASIAEPTVDVEVAGRYFRFPEPVLSECAYRLRLSIGGLCKGGISNAFGIGAS
jgi:hypothetical protein